MKYNKIDSALFENNRTKFINELKPNTLAVFNSNDILPTNADGTMPFKQNSDLFWLSGIDQEESVLLLFPNSNEDSMLFIKETNDHIAIWEGNKLTKEIAQEISGIKKIFWLADLEKKLDELIPKCSAIYLNKNMHSRATNSVETRDDRFRNSIKNNYQITILESALIMHNIRSIKSKPELKLLQKACDITHKGVERILPIIKPGIMEYEIEAELIYEFIRNKSNGFAYQPIIGSGANSCVLHYISNNNECKDGDILLMDFGAEYANYCSDLTRTIPVNGKFNDRQKAVYKSVLYVMKEATKMLCPGTTFKEYNKEIGRMMELELIKLGLLEKVDVKNQDPKNPLYKKYFMHGTSHYIGLDTHDVGSWTEPIEENMVFTVEPGIYIPEEGIGIRLEDDVVVQKNSEPKNLMENIPIEAEEIEDLMN